MTDVGGIAQAEDVDGVVVVVDDDYVVVVGMRG